MRKGSNAPWQAKRQREAPEGLLRQVQKFAGGPAERRHSPRGAAKKALLLAAVAGLGCWAWRRSSSRRGRLR